MNASELYIGLDVHKDSTTIAIAEPGPKGEIRLFGNISNSILAVERALNTIRSVILEPPPPMHAHGKTGAAPRPQGRGRGSCRQFDWVAHALTAVCFWNAACLLIMRLEGPVRSGRGQALPDPIESE
jgi:hypothetical protein